MNGPLFLGWDGAMGSWLRDASEQLTQDANLSPVARISPIRVDGFGVNQISLRVTVSETSETRYGLYTLDEAAGLSDFLDEVAGWLQRHPGRSSFCPLDSASLQNLSKVNAWLIGRRAGKDKALDLLADRAIRRATSTTDWPGLLGDARRAVVMVLNQIDFDGTDGLMGDVVALLARSMGGGIGASSWLLNVEGGLADSDSGVARLHRHDDNALLVRAVEDLASGGKDLARHKGVLNLAAGLLRDEQVADLASQFPWLLDHTAFRVALEKRDLTGAARAGVVTPGRRL